MANYKESTITGAVSDYQRSNKVIIANELDSIAEITFMEQILTSLPDGRKIITGTTKCSDSMYNPQEQFNLLHPETDAILGTATYMDVYVTLYSVYRYIAAKRDAASVAALNLA